MIKTFILRLPSELHEKMRKKADQLAISANSYLINLIEKDLNFTVTSDKDSNQEKTIEKELPTQIKLSEEF